VKLPVKIGSIQSRDKRPPLHYQSTTATSVGGNNGTTIQEATVAPLQTRSKTCLHYQTSSSEGKEGRRTRKERMTTVTEHYYASCLLLLTSTCPTDKRTSSERKKEDG